MARDGPGRGPEEGSNPRLGFRSRELEGSFPLVPNRRALFQRRVARSAARLLRKGALILSAAMRLSLPGILCSAASLASALAVSLPDTLLWLVTHFTVRVFPGLGRNTLDSRGIRLDPYYVVNALHNGEKFGTISFLMVSYTEADPRLSRPRGLCTGGAGPFTVRPLSAFLPGFSRETLDSQLLFWIFWRRRSQGRSPPEGLIAA